MGFGGERNKPCSCGSGKKTKVCCQGRKPAQKTITFDFGVPKEVVSVTIDASGDVSLEASDGAAPISVVHADIRDRDKGSKYLTRVPLRANEANRYGILPTLCKYKAIYVIDTNSREIEGKIVSVSYIMACRLEKDGDIYNGKGRTVAVFEFHECLEKPENFAIMILQSMIIDRERNGQDDLFAIVNDSDLGNYELFNDRSLPIYGDVYLSPNISLLYASVDTGNGILNRLIRQCDNLAAKMLRAMCTAGLEKSTAKRVKNGPCTRFQLYPIFLQNPVLFDRLSLGTNLPLQPDPEGSK